MSSIKHYLSAPLLFLALPAAAELNISGQLQQEFVHWSSSDSLSGKQVGDGALYSADESRHDGGGASSITLKGSRNLRRNYRAIAEVSFDLNLNSPSELGDRDAYIGFVSDQSLWRFGRMSSPYSDVTQDWDPFFGTFMQARGNGGLSLAHHSGYLEDSIGYQSQWWGIDLDFVWSIDQQDSDDDSEVDRDDSRAIALHKSLSGWDLALAYEDDPINERGSAAKAAALYREGDWQYQLQYERLDDDEEHGFTTLFNITYLNGDTHIGFSAGQTDSPTEVEHHLKYYALGVKYAMTQDAIFHIGYRITRTDSTPDENERSVGMGLRFNF